MHTSTSCCDLVGTPFYSGELKKKQHALALWTNCYAELRQNELYLLSSPKSKRVTARIPISRSMSLEVKQERSTTFIELANGGKSIIKLSTCNKDDIRQLLASLQSAIDHDVQFSMDNFNIRSTIGRGFFGKVMLVENKENHELYALKTIRKDKLSHQENILCERNLLGKLNHPFIVSLRFAFQSATKYYLGMEYVPGGDLNSLLHSHPIFPLQQVRFYLAEIGLALEYIHSKGIAYRDLKPENVLIAADGHIKLTDFGLAKEIGTSRTSTFCGTAEYIAPEMLARRPYTLSVDWWQYGILAYNLVFNRTPFYNDNKSLMFRYISNNQPKFPDGTDKDVQDFITRLLSKEPRNRPSFNDLREHPFWRGLNFEDILNKKITPTYIPQLISPTDANCFDKEFTQEEPIDSTAQPCLASTIFTNFSFIANDSGDSPPIAEIL